MLHTHMQNLIKETEKAQKKGRSSGGGLFKKNTEGSAVSAYMRQLGKSCYICDRITRIFDRYIDTVFYLYEKDSAFKTKFDSSKGFCVNHYAVLYDAADAHMSDMSYAFEVGLSAREFEPDGPNWTPRISAMLSFLKANDFTYKMSILKSADAEGSTCNRYTFNYNAVAGLGHFIHTYNHDGNPIPTFTGEPERVAVPDDIDEYTETIWNGLDENNKVSLYVAYVDLATGQKETRIINKNK